VSKILGLGGALVLCLSLQASTVLYDNTAAFPDGSDPIAFLGPLFDSFSTGANSGALSDSEFLLSGDPTSSGSISVDLFADNATSVGSLIANLGTINDSQLSGSPSLITLNLASNPQLAANTRYWIGLTGPASSGFWSWSRDISGDGVANEFLTNAVNIANGVPPFPAEEGAYQMEIAVPSASTTPEPTSLFLSGVALLTGGFILRRRVPRSVPR
jgi:hypothetical protein